MNHLTLVNDLILRTRRRQLQWEDFGTVSYGILSPLQNEFAHIYSTNDNGHILLITESLHAAGEDGHYALLFMDWNIKEIDRIEEETLLSDVRSPRPDDSKALERLYRTALRNSRDLDRILERIVNHI